MRVAIVLPFGATNTSEILQMNTATLEMPRTRRRTAAPSLTPARMRAAKVAAKLGIHPGTIPHGEEDDPFYSESNLRRTLESIAQANAGNLVKHDLIEV